MNTPYRDGTTHVIFEPDDFFATRDWLENSNPHKQERCRVLLGKLLLTARERRICDFSHKCYVCRWGFVKTLSS